MTAPKFFLFLLFLNSISLSAQNCKKDKILGEWEYVTSAGHVYTNIDSLKAVLDTAKRSLGTWTFYENDMFEATDKYFKSHQKNKPYLFDEKTCEIILKPKKKNSRTEHNLEIIYFDDKYFIYKSDNNPWGYYTYLHRRK